MRLARNLALLAEKLLPGVIIPVVPGNSDLHLAEVEIVLLLPGVASDRSNVSPRFGKEIHSLVREQ